MDTVACLQQCASPVVVSWRKMKIASEVPWPGTWTTVLIESMLTIPPMEVSSNTP